MNKFLGGLIGLALVIALVALAYVQVRRDLGWADNLPGRNANASDAPGPILATDAQQVHPLDAALELARQVQQNIEQNVHDYTATVVKQERYAGQLKPAQVCDIKMRNRPFSVYMKFIAPEDVKGQEALYVDGANDNKLIGHAGSGVRALVGSVWLDPTGTLAMLGQRYPITNMGIANLIKKLIEVGQHDRQYGECYVWRNDNAKVGDRPCISITVMHPTRRSQFIFHIARIFIDKERMVPLNYEAYDWPEHPDEPPLLLERYTYTNLKLNPGLTDADFDPHNPEYNFGLK
jgi:Protein of unknown function (DUF1571)